MSDMREQVLQVAGDLTQARGFNGFSYIDLSNAVGIKTSSIHYYFKKKDDLAVALIDRQRKIVGEKLAAIDTAQMSPQASLQALGDLFKSFITGRRDNFCLCGMLAAEFAAMNDPARAALKAYFDDVRGWLAGQFVRLDPSIPSDQAQAKALGFIGALEGVLLIARLEKNPALIDQAIAPFFKISGR